MNRKLSICLLLIMAHVGALFSAPRASQPENNYQRVERAKARPDLAAQLDGVAELKIATRKSTFHVGEMITLDVALLNTSTQPLFFRKLSDLRIKAQTAAGEQMYIQSYGVADRVIIPDSFTLLSQNEVLLHSFQLLAGCDKRAFNQMQSANKDNLTLFKNNLFLNWGDACLTAALPGTYIFSVEAINEHVLIAPRVRKTKTAVGKLSSNQLEITIIK